MTRTARIPKVILTLYIFTVFTLIPLAMPTGYKNLGEMKCSLFLKAAAVFTPLFLIFLIGAFISGRTRLKDYRTLLTLTVIFAANLTLSSALSADFQKSLSGSPGWRMGLFAFLAMLVSALAAAVFNLPGGYIYLPLLAGAAASSIIAAANRFGLDLMMPHLSAENRQDFIGTLGNINWFAGFLTVTIPIAISLLFSDNKKMRTAGSITLFILLTAAVLQGSNGLLPALCAVFIVLFVLASADRTYQRPFLTMLLILGAAMEACAAAVLLFPGAYNGPADNLFLRIAGFHIGLFIVGAAVLCLHFQKKGQFDNLPRAAKFLLPTVLTLAVLLPLLLLIIQLTVTLPRNFGTYRGFIWHVAKSGFKKLPFLNMLFGVGPDLMGDYLVSVPGFQDLISAVYGNAKLLNAHSMLLTQLLNTGILGVSSHLILVTFALKKGLTALYAYKKEGSPEPTWLLASLLGVISYDIYMMFSFDQVTVTPLFYILLGALYSENPSRTTVGS